MKKKHEEILCEKCSSIFLSREDLLKHQEVHKEDVLHCNQGDYTTAVTSELEEHVKSQIIYFEVINQNRTTYCLGGF